MSCGISMIKYILFLLNILCWLFGSALIGLGIFILVGLKELQGMEFVPICIIILGSIIFIISFFGCCGAIRENHCMTITYSVILLILVILQIVATVYLFLGGDLIEKSLEKSFDDSLKGDPVAKQHYESMETLFKCCGKSSPLDYSGLELPKSCCEDNTIQCTQSTAYSVGCVKKLHDQFGPFLKVTSFVSLGIALVEAIAFIFACTLGNHIRNTHRRSTF